MALEPHIEKPDESAAFQKFPKVLANSFASSIICDYMRMVGMNADDPNQIEDVMARELKKTLNEELHAAHALQMMADALPALGIVAAVLGVIKTMSHIDRPPAILGAMIASALCGTFLGVLLAYGLAGPCAARLKSVVEEEAKVGPRGDPRGPGHPSAWECAASQRGSPAARWCRTSTCLRFSSWRRRYSRCRSANLSSLKRETCSGGLCRHPRET